MRRKTRHSVLRSNAIEAATRSPMIIATVFDPFETGGVCLAISANKDEKRLEFTLVAKS